MIILPAKDVRNLIVTLVILAIGVKVIAVLGKGFASNTSLVGAASLTASLDSLSNLLLLGITVLIAVLIPVYLSKRSEEKKSKGIES